MYDEIIKQHRTSSDRWLATSDETNWHQNHWEVTKFFLSSNPSTIRTCERIDCLECVDLLDIMINNLAFQKEISCQIDSPSDVVSKAISYLNNEVYTTDEDMFQDFVHYTVTIVKSIIHQMPSTQIAVQNLQQLEKRYNEQMYNHRGFQNESDKLEESINKRQTSFTGDEGKMEWLTLRSIEVDNEEKQYGNTLKETDRHYKDIVFETEYPALLSKDEYERVLIEAETSCRKMTEKKTKPK